MKAPRDIKIIGASMEEARERKGMSIKGLSRASGVHIHTISNSEKGISSPTLLTAYLLADALGITLAEYIGERKARIY